MAQATRTARLSFAGKEVADRVHGKFRRNVYKVLGQTVDTDGPEYGRRSAVAASEEITVHGPLCSGMCRWMLPTRTLEGHFV